MKALYLPLILSLGFGFHTSGCGEVRSLADAGTSDAMVVDLCKDGIKNGEEEGIDCGGECTACVECDLPSECASGLCQDNHCLNTKTVSCTDAAPENANATLADVTVSWTATGWETAAECAWSCNSDFGLVENRCLHEQRVDCNANQTPDNALITATQVTIVYSDSAGWGIPANCSWQCETGYDNYNNLGQCINQRSVPCSIADTPSNATPTPGSNVIINFVPSTGVWETPANCPWSCNVDYCPTTTDQCDYAYPTEVIFENGRAAAWYGGDLMPTPARNVGQGMRLESLELEMATFAFRFKNAFTAGASTPSADVILRLDLHDANGTSLSSSTVNVPATFSGGWVEWNMSQQLTASNAYSFTSYVPNGYVNGLRSSIRADSNSPAPAIGYPEGYRLSRIVRNASDNLSNLDGWTGSPSGWDLNFRIREAPICTLP